MSEPFSPVISPIAAPFRTPADKGRPWPFGASGPAFDLYVDSVAGSDSNDGTSESAPLATLSAAQTAAQTIGDGVRIGLKRGSYWADTIQFGNINDALCGAYGSTSDPLPEIDSTDQAANGGFSAVSGTTNVYQISWNHTLNQNDEYHFVFEDGDRLTFVSDETACDSTPGSYTYDNASPQTNPITIKVHPKGSTDPASDGKTYRITARDQSIFMQGDNCVIEGIHGTKNAQGGGSFKITGKNGTIKNCLATWGNKHHAFVGANGRVENFVGYLGSEQPLANASVLVSYHADASLTDAKAEFKNCYLHPKQRVTSGVDQVSGTTEGYYVHTGGAADDYAEVIADGVFVYGALAAFSAVAEKHVIKNSISHWCREGVRGGDTIEFNNSTYFANNEFVNYNQARLIKSGGSTKVTLSNARVAATGGCDLFSNGGPANADLEIVDSIIAMADQIVPPNPSYVLVENNILASKKFYDRTTGVDVAESNYFWNNFTPNEYIVNGNTYDTLSALQSGEGIDLDSQESATAGGLDLVDMSNNGDFATTLNSGPTMEAPKIPDWASLITAWEAGYLGIDGTGP
jgi:hypothetical protein